MSADALVAFRGVSKTYGARKALDEVTLELAPGEMVALIGPSGSGKSTLLRAAAGLIPIDAGEGRIAAFGETLQAEGRVGEAGRRLRARVGFVFQQFNLVGRLSVFTNVALGLLGRLPFLQGLLGLWPPAGKARVMAALARVGLAEQAGQRADALSGGQQQRAAIARALVQEADAIFADEPVASLDPVSARRVMDLLADLNRQEGIGVIVSLHQVDYALRYCRRIVALKAGKVVYDGPPKGLDRRRLVDIYGPEIEDVFWEGEADRWA
jgi:phosphonate transport system ATP-binding protein